MKLHVKVTEDHIRAGARTSSRSCAIALAINEAAKEANIKGFERASVGPNDADLVGDGFRHGGFLPAVARDFIQDFDNSRPVKPIEFDLETEWEPRSA